MPLSNDKNDRTIILVLLDFQFARPLLKVNELDVRLFKVIIQ